MSQSLDFYTRILGFKIEFDRPESKFAYLSFYGSLYVVRVFWTQRIKI